VIGRLRGILVERSGDEIVVDCSGVGYEVHVSAHTLATLPAVDAPVTLRIFTHTNPQDMRTTLFGFGSVEERELFDLLITVKKVGPTAAMGILSGGMTPGDIARTIAAGNTAVLQKIKGVGKKTAEMIVVELKDKCEGVLMRWGAANLDGGASGVVPMPAAPTTVTVRDPMVEDVVLALVQMGWRSTEADKAAAMLQPGPESTLESLLRQALQAMPR